MNWWQKRQQIDPFVKKREERGILSRSYFKIEEIYIKYNIQSNKVLELGAAPGGWTEYVIKICKEIIAIDLLELKLYKQNIKFFQQDIRTFKTKEVFDTILSDIAPNISGNLLVDNAFMEQMIEIYYNLILNNLQEKGTLVFKSFQWECNQLIKKIIMPNFEKMRIFKPKSSRSASSEIYIVCQNKKNIFEI